MAFFSAVAVCKHQDRFVLPPQSQVLSAFAANPAVFGSDKFVLFSPSQSVRKLTKSSTYKSRVSGTALAKGW